MRLERTSQIKQGKTVYIRPLPDLIEKGITPRLQTVQKVGSQHIYLINHNNLDRNVFYRKNGVSRCGYYTIYPSREEYLKCRRINYSLSQLDKTREQISSKIMEYSEEEVQALEQAINNFISKYK